MKNRTENIQLTPDEFMKRFLSSMDTVKNALESEEPKSSILHIYESGQVKSHEIAECLSFMTLLLFNEDAWSSANFKPSKKCADGIVSLARGNLNEFPDELRIATEYIVESLLLKVKTFMKYDVEPKEGSIYSKALVSESDDGNKSYEEIASSFWSKPSSVPSIIFEFNQKIKRLEIDDFNVVLTDKDISAMRHNFLAQEKPLSNKFINTVLKSKYAFIGDVTKEQFCQALVEAVENPKTVAYSAYYCLGNAALKSSNADSIIDSPDIEFFKTSIDENGSLIGVNPQIFQTGVFEKNPLTIDEIRAIPRITGYAKKAFEIAGVNDCSLSKSVIEKLKKAGFAETADYIEKKAVVKNSRDKNDVESGPGY